MVSEGVIPIPLPHDAKMALDGYRFPSSFGPRGRGTLLLCTCICFILITIDQVRALRPLKRSLSERPSGATWRGARRGKLAVNGQPCAYGETPVRTISFCGRYLTGRSTTSRPSVWDKKTCVAFLRSVPLLLKTTSHAAHISQLPHQTH